MKPSYDGTVFVVIVETPEGMQEPMVFAESDDAHAEFRRQADTLAMEAGEEFKEIDIELYRDHLLYWTNSLSAVRLYNPLLIRKDA